MGKPREQRGACRKEVPQPWQGKQEAAGEEQVICGERHAEWLGWRVVF